MPPPSLYVLQWITLTGVFGVAVISPGPDFVLAVRHALTQTRRTGLFLAFGIGLGVFIHASYTMLGLAAVIAASPLMFSLLKYAGGAYLIWLGAQGLRSQGASAAPETSRPTPPAMTDAQAFRMGLLTNLLNPKAALFFMAVLTQIVSVHTPIGWQATYALTCAAMTTTWFCGVAWFLTRADIRARFLRITKWTDRLCGGLLIALGVSVILEIH